MGRSLYGLVIFTKVGVSPNLSSSKAWPSGGPGRDDAGSGGCAFCFTQMGADKGADERRLEFKAQLPFTLASPAGMTRDCSCVLNFKYNPTAPGRVESTPPPYLLCCGGK